MRGTNQQRVLAMLAAAQPRIVEHATLLDAMYGDDPDGGPDGARDVLTLVIHHLRKKIGRDAIVSHNRIGYNLAPHVKQDDIRALLPVQVHPVLRARLDEILGAAHV